MRIREIDEHIAKLIPEMETKFGVTFPGSPWSDGSPLFWGVKPKHPPGPPMTLGNMRRQGVHHLIAYCLNEAAIIIAEQDYARRRSPGLPGESGPEDEF